MGLWSYLTGWNPGSSRSRIDDLLPIAANATDRLLIRRLKWTSDLAGAPRINPATLPDSRNRL